MNAHPSQTIHGALMYLEERFVALRVIGLGIWTRIIRKAQAKQDAVNAETSRECREIETLIVAYAKDGRFTEAERDHLIRKIQEIGTEIESGEVIKG